ncbi:MAG: glycosyltransferase family 9 protein [Syntrophobacteraceae bacterium]|nr:glycosyltransferase family 9 protein [Desulfobacteraceae bacterium]
MPAEAGTASSPAFAPACALHRVVVVHQGALGDFLLALPAFEGLARLHPGLKIDFLSRPGHVALLASRGYVGRIESHDSPGLAPFHHEELWNGAPLPPLLQGPDAVFIFGRKTGRLLADRLSRRLPCPVQYVQSFPDPGDGRHVSDFILDQMHRAGWFPDGYTPPPGLIDPPPEESSAAQEWLAQHGFKVDNKPFLIHPGSGGRAKIWPLSRWWALFHALFSRRVPALLTLGPADEELEAFAGAVRSLGVPTLRGLSLPGLCAFLRESRKYIGNDSGVSHLAALTGVDSVVVFGPTDPAVWSPRGPNVRTVRSHWEESEVFAWSPTIPPPLLEEWAEDIFRWEGR